MSVFPSKVKGFYGDNDPKMEKLGKPDEEGRYFTKGVDIIWRKKGLDQFKIWIDRCYEDNINPWISFRINDAHSTYDDDNFLLNEDFVKHNCDHARIRHRAQFQYYDRCRDYELEPVRKEMLDYIEETLCGLKFKLSPRSFFQVNPAQAEKLYEKALEFSGAGNTDSALDFYCGTGTISLILAQKAGFVYGIEVVPEAIADARENAAANGVENVEFICGDAAKAAAKLNSRGVAPSVAVVDPPRKGLTPELIETIAAMSPERVPTFPATARPSPATSSILAP
jgi:hypothetical protein